MNSQHVVLGNVLYRDILQEQVIEPFQAASPERHPPAPSVGDMIHPGSRNATLLTLAGTMRRRGMSQGAIEAALSVENFTRCVPPIEENEVRAIAHSAARYTPPTQAGQATQLSHRKPFKRKVQMILPLTYAEVNGERWSWCESKMRRLHFKKSIADAAVDGVVPEGHLRTPAQAYQDVMGWLQQLGAGEIHLDQVQFWSGCICGNRQRLATNII